MRSHKHRVAKLEQCISQREVLLFSEDVGDILDHLLASYDVGPGTRQTVLGAWVLFWQQQLAHQPLLLPSGTAHAMAAEGFERLHHTVTHWWPGHSDINLLWADFAAQLERRAIETQSAHRPS